MMQMELMHLDQHEEAAEEDNEEEKEEHQGQGQERGEEEDEEKQEGGNSRKEETGRRVYRMELVPVDRTSPTSRASLSDTFSGVVISVLSAIGTLTYSACIKLTYHEHERLPCR